MMLMTVVIIKSLFLYFRERPSCLIEVSFLIGQRHDKLIWWVSLLELLWLSSMKTSCSESSCKEFLLE